MNQDNESETYYSDYQWQKAIDKYELSELQLGQQTK